VTPEGVTVATIVYPGVLSTVDEPPELACRFFDPEPIEVPDDGTPPVAAITADAMPTAYLDAVADATDPEVWQVLADSEAEADGVPVTCVLANATVDTAGVPVGTIRYQCFADVGAAGTVVLRTEAPPAASAGEPPSPEFQVRMAVVSLMTFASTYLPPA
jgi:hypothetical protein